MNTIRQKLIPILIILFSTNAFSQITECKLSYYNEYGSEIKDKSFQPNLSPIATSTRARYKDEDGLGTFVAMGKIPFKANPFYYGYEKGAGSSIFAVSHYEKLGSGYRQVKERVDDKLKKNVSTGSNLNETDYALSIENAWLTKQRKWDGSSTVVSNRKYVLTDKRVHKFETDFHCVSTHYMNEKYVVGLWYKKEERILFFVVWNLETNKVNKYKLTDNYGGKSKLERTKSGYYAVLHDTYLEGNNGTYFKEIDIKKTISAKTLILKADLNLKDVAKLALQDFIVDRRDDRVVGVYHTSENGFGKIWMLQISADRKSYKVSSMTGLDPDLWSARGANKAPEPKRGEIKFQTRRGGVSEFNIRISQRSDPYNNYVVLLRPFEEKLTFSMPSSQAGNNTNYNYSDRTYHTDNPTFVAFDTENLLPYSWDFFNLFNYSSEHFDQYKSPLSKFRFAAFQIKTEFDTKNFNINNPKASEQEWIKFIEAPKVRSGVHTSREYTIKVREGTALKRSSKKSSSGGGNLAANFRWDKTWPISSGLVCVKKDGKYGFINTEGKVVIPLNYEGAYPFKDGYNITGVSMNGKRGYINKQNEVVIPLQYDRVFKIHQGMIRVKSGDKYGYHNVNGKLIFEPQFDEAEDFSFAEHASISKGGKSGKVYKTGEIKWD